MDISDLVVACISAAVIGGALVNIKTFEDAKSWLQTHGVDPLEYLEPRFKRHRSDSLNGAVQYYVGYLGRRLAYRLYSSQRRI